MPILGIIAVAAAGSTGSTVACIFAFVEAPIIFVAEVFRMPFLIQLPANIQPKVLKVHNFLQQWLYRGIIAMLLSLPLFATSATIFSGVLLILAGIAYLLAAFLTKETGEQLTIGEPSIKQKTAMALKDILSSKDAAPEDAQL